MSTQVLIDSLSATDGRSETAVLHVLTDADYDLTRFMHAHPHGELFLLRSGFVKSRSAAGQWLIPAGHLCWIPPGAAHGAETDRIRGVRIHLSAELCQGLPSEPRVLASTPIILAIIDRLAADARPRMSLSPPEANLLKVLLDEISGTQGLPIVLPMPSQAKPSEATPRCVTSPSDGYSNQTTMRGSTSWRRLQGCPDAASHVISRRKQACQWVAGANSQDCFMG
jgi:hypothetical protein